MSMVIGYLGWSAWKRNIISPCFDPFWNDVVILSSAGRCVNRYVSTYVDKGIRAVATVIPLRLCITHDGVTMAEYRV